MTITLRPYQSALVDDVREAWQSGATTPLAHLATGGGKTAIIGHIIETHDGPSCLVAHRSELVSQLSQTLAAYGVEHDIIASDATRRIVAAVHVMRFGRCFLRVGSRCRVASVDTLIRRTGLESWAARVTLWVCDEGHHLVLDNKWHKAVSAFTHPHVRGLLPTATPSRADGKGLGRHADGLADVLLAGPSPRWLIEEGWLCDYDVMCPTSDMEVLTDVAASGDWSPKALKEASQKSHIVGDVVGSYLDAARGRLGVTFATDVETATQMAAAYRAAGVPAEVLTGETDDRLRASILQRFERREVLQLCVVDIVSEGFDLPAIEVLSMARPTASLGLYLQQFGRGLRPVFAPGYPTDTAEQRIAAQHASGKGRRVLLIDHVGNFVRHQGGPDAPRVWTLDRRDKRRSAGGGESLRVCTECFKPFKRVMTACPHCGAEIPPPAGRAGPEQVDGDLALLSPEVLAALRADLPESEAGYRERLMATGLPEVPLRANMRRHRERLDALAALRLEMAVWSGRLHAAGMSDREIHKAFWLEFGMTTIEALSLGRKEAEALRTRINPFSVPLAEPADGWARERERARAEPDYWTEERIMEEANKYKTRVDFKNGSPSAYQAARKLGVTDAVCGHMKTRQIAPPGYWTDERLSEAALKYDTRRDFIERDKTAYIKCCQRGILDQVCAHMKALKKAWTFENISEAAGKHATRMDFKKANLNAYEAAMRQGILDEVCSHMKAIVRWDAENLPSEAAKYDTRGAFRKGSNGAYAAALRLGVLDDLFPKKGT